MLPPAGDRDLVRRGEAIQNGGVRPSPRLGPVVSGKDQAERLQRRVLGVERSDPVVDADVCPHGEHRGTGNSFQRRLENERDASSVWKTAVIST